MQTEPNSKFEDYIYIITYSYILISRSYYLTDQLLSDTLSMTVKGLCTTIL